jgi:peptidoglycan hydrolase-like protein with peptidoglycan-binding domain
MPLLSKLFRGDKALEACQINDSAHLVLGTRGPHVKKVQQALTLLDGALIDRDETATGLYGKTTADAVLSYKQKRSIINRTYQNTADNIVGKMTISSLDREVLSAEGRPALQGCSGERGQGAGAVQFAGRPLNFGDSRQVEFPPARLNVAFQEALLERETINTNSLRTVLLVQRATQLLAPFGLKLSTRFLPTFSYAYTVGERESFDVHGIRKTAEAASGRLDGSLRVIFCHLRNTTSTATSQGAFTGVTGFPNFVLINKDLQHPDNGTLLHEMIHCSSDRFMPDIHDSDRNSVFSRGDNRNLLQVEHAKSLSECFFRTAGF